MISASIAAWIGGLTIAAAGPQGGHGHYSVLTCTPHKAPPAAAVDVIYGPAEDLGGRPGRWWQLEARAADDPASPPLVRVQMLVDADPLIPTDEPATVHRYLVELPETNERYEYRNLHGGPLLPAWSEFGRWFVPHPAAGARTREGFPETAEYLGHVLCLRWVGRDAPWKPIQAEPLELDPELLVGTSRSFRDQEGHRLPQVPERKNYTYVPFVEADYAKMMEAGINLYIVEPTQEAFVRGQPVFYIRQPGGTPPLRYPADFYRSNYLGTSMFMDEPSIITVGDKLIHNTLQHFSDAAALFVKRTRQEYEADTRALQRSLAGQVAFGDMILAQTDLPAWETYYDTTYYLAAGGAAGIVHEGRYQLEPFDKAVARWTEKPRQHTAEELLRYHYAFLRGGTRPFGAYWGTAIYGQCDPKLSPLAMTLAYDMGARCLWFWTSDHDHHMPWPEQLDLARTLKKHAADHPRPSIAPPPQRDLAIAIPYGYFLSLDNLWWVRAMDTEGKNEASQRYARLMRRAHAAIQTAFDAHEDFDLTIDDGRPITGYRRVLRINDEP